MHECMPMFYMPASDFHLSSIYIEEEVFSKSGKVDRTILQFSFHDDEGQL